MVLSMLGFDGEISSFLLLKLQIKLSLQSVKYGEFSRETAEVRSKEFSEITRFELARFYYIHKHT